MVSRLAFILGWLLIAGAGYHALRMHSLDRTLQAHRMPGAPARAFAFVPLRWRDELYTAEGQPLVVAAWRAFGSCIGWAFVGMLLVGLFS